MVGGCGCRTTDNTSKNVCWNETLCILSAIDVCASSVQPNGKTNSRALYLHHHALQNLRRTPKCMGKKKHNRRRKAHTPLQALVNKNALLRQVSSLSNDGIDLKLQCAVIVRETGLPSSCGTVKSEMVHSEKGASPKWQEKKQAICGRVDFPCKNYCAMCA